MKENGIENTLKKPSDNKKKFPLNLSSTMLNLHSSNNNSSPELNLKIFPNQMSEENDNLNEIKIKKEKEKEIEEKDFEKMKSPRNFNEFNVDPKDAKIVELEIIVESQSKQIKMLEQNLLTQKNLKIQLIEEKEKKKLLQNRISEQTKQLRILQQKYKPRSEKNEKNPKNETIQKNPKNNKNNINNNSIDNQELNRVILEEKHKNEIFNLKNELEKEKEKNKILFEEKDNLGTVTERYLEEIKEKNNIINLEKIKNENLQKKILNLQNEINNEQTNKKKNRSEINNLRFENRNLNNRNIQNQNEIFNKKKEIENLRKINLTEKEKSTKSEILFNNLNKDYFEFQNYFFQKLLQFENNFERGKYDEISQKNQLEFKYIDKIDKIHTCSICNSILEESQYCLRNCHISFCKKHLKDQELCPECDKKSIPIPDIDLEIENLLVLCVICDKNITLKDSKSHFFDSHSFFCRSGCGYSASYGEVSLHEKNICPLLIEQKYLFLGNTIHGLNTYFQNISLKFFQKK